MFPQLPVYSHMRKETTATAESKNDIDASKVSQVPPGAMTSADRVIEIGQLLARALVRQRCGRVKQFASSDAASAESLAKSLDSKGHLERSLHGNDYGGSHE